MVTVTLGDGTGRSTFVLQPAVGCHPLPRGPELAVRGSPRCTRDGCGSTKEVEFLGATLPISFTRRITPVHPAAEG